ncbi:MAG: EutN/CcmL family microcompartment protein [Calditrichia bacterium]|nr:EutN/CcmL family microcompartment protein [Calditrichia bacterium]
MIIGRVSGTIYSTINHEFYDGKKLMIVDKLNADGIPTGKYLVAVDSVQAGIGETVLVIDEGNSARQIIKDSDAPIRSIIVGIIDDINYIE